MRLQTMVRPFAVKATSDATRTVSGLAAAWTLDLGGDVIAPGAFKRTLSDWRRSNGKVIQFCDSHRRDSVRAVVGKMTDATETAEGLAATFMLVPGPDGEEVYQRIKGGFVDGLSIGYEVVRGRAPTAAERAAGVERVLTEVKLREVSIVIWPMNEDARADAATAKGDGRAAYLAALAGEGGALAPEDPRRVALESRYRALVLAHLETRAAHN